MNPKIAVIGRSQKILSHSFLDQLCGQFWIEGVLHHFVYTRLLWFGSSIVSKLWFELCLIMCLNSLFFRSIHIYTSPRFGLPHSIPYHVSTAASLWDYSHTEWVSEHQYEHDSWLRVTPCPSLQQGYVETACSGKQMGNIVEHTDLLLFSHAVLWLLPHSRQKCQTPLA